MPYVIVHTNCKLAFSGAYSFSKLQYLLGMIQSLPYAGISVIFYVGKYSACAQEFLILCRLVQTQNGFAHMQSASGSTPKCTNGYIGAGKFYISPSQ